MRVSRPVAYSDIVALHNQGFGSVSEETLKDVLRRYNLREGLISVGRVSCSLFNKGLAVVKDPETGTLISQFALAYIANILLISGANDHKSKTLSQPGMNNLSVLCSIYNNCLIQPELSEGYKFQLNPFLIRVDFEQMRQRYLIARTKLLFEVLAEQIVPEKFEKLPVVFQHVTGLSLHEYLLIAFAVLAVCKRNPTFSMPALALTQGELLHLKTVFTDENVNRFLGILRSNYSQFQALDSKRNNKVSPVYTKTRFNPLTVWPIIETKEKWPGGPYVIPNLSHYALKAFGGLFWWFHLHFEMQQAHHDFRTYFGRVFQEYVGLILRGIYGDEIVHGEIHYSRDKKFIDWWVDKGEKIYLFEAKAYQFALETWQTAEDPLLNKETKKKSTLGFSTSGSIQS